ncbi:glycoside hydrolase family 20 zincin-like fold domain-containing protein [Cohnella sp. GbtcB17]|uniref:glycoside hydrolase family 20 zincin-like fold domain-containing protein n=1 Tax=Cohnella sp. GbtcB17 TaxID=2824762 RepID=UPI001C304C27|nr:glycoside hydrolase family 20 zincin-like fold domain-containing protein [Cohnella sp. GbtcB17]
MMLELRTDPDRIALPTPHFPTRMQAVVWRNWGLVPIKRLASVLGASAKQIKEVASGLGLEMSATGNEEIWLKRGYITIIRANWHLLPFGQLLELLGWTEAQLAFTLKEDDFLWIKLGSFKPWTEPVRYRPLSAEEQELTRQIRETVAGLPDLRRAGTASGTGTAPGIGTVPGARLEKPFAFLDYGRKPDMRHPVQYREPAPGEIRMDIPWTIEAPDATPILESALERFATRHEQVWGTKWIVRRSFGRAPGAPANPVVRIEIAADASAGSEDHAVIVEEDRITIRAAAETGIMRGLQWIAGQTGQGRVPYLMAGTYTRTTKFDLRIIYSYSAVYGDPLLTPESDPYPEDLLERLSEAGVNGIWLQSVLYNLVPLNGLPKEMSADWEKRIAGLRLLAARAAKYGIGVYLYCNEPRSMPLSFFADKPDWQGHAEDGYATMCTSHPEVQAMLRDGISRLFGEVPELAGLFTITMSENWTHCYSRAVNGITNCPRCAQRRPGEVAAEVNGIIAEGAFRVKPDARILCWTWGWASGWGWTEKEIEFAIEKLPDNVIVMATSEEAIPTSVAGVRGQVADYSMSVVGPGDKSLRSWQAAQARGLRTAAKVQFNNTWECSAVPFLPVFQLIEEHLGRLKESGVTGLMLSWTLGGYPSLNLALAADYYWETDSHARPSIRERMEDKFGSAAGRAIADASAAFAGAFRQFPFDLAVLYFAPQNFGPANLLHLNPTGFEATMIGYPYDDLKSWRGIYSAAQFAGQFKKLAGGWKKGLRLLEAAGEKLSPGSERAYDELMTAATAAYLHFYSTFLQIDFVRTREKYATARSLSVRLKACRRLIDIARAEAGNAGQLHDLVCRDSRIGFEASNHYYYTVQDLREKTLNCRGVIEALQNIERQLTEL